VSAARTARPCGESLLELTFQALGRDAVFCLDLDRNRGVTVIDEIAWDSAVRSCYFNDPAGNLLEIAERDLWTG